jgi:hypothetical protein
LCLGRGKFCEHFQCFDLQVYFTLNIKDSLSPWACPICKRRSVEVIRDSFFENIVTFCAANNLLEDKLSIKSANCNISAAKDGRVFEWSDQKQAFEWTDKEQLLVALPSKRKRSED